MVVINVIYTIQAYEFLNRKKKTQRKKWPYNGYKRKLSNAIFPKHIFCTLSQGPLKSKENVLDWPVNSLTSALFRK